MPYCVFFIEIYQTDIKPNCCIVRIKAKQVIVMFKALTQILLLIRKANPQQIAIVDEFTPFFRKMEVAMKCCKLLSNDAMSTNTQRFVMLCQIFENKHASRVRPKLEVSLINSVSTSKM